MKFDYIIKITLCLNFLLILVNSMNTKSKKYTSEVFDPNYAHFAESLYNPNYTPEGNSSHYIS